MESVSKTFGAVQALQQVNLSLGQGEVLGLVGDNAAGKSTLMKILTGAHTLDQGRILSTARRSIISQTGSGLRPGTVWAYFDTEGQAGFNVEVFKALAGTSGRTPAFVDGKMVG